MAKNRDSDHTVLLLDDDDRPVPFPRRQVVPTARPAPEATGEADALGQLVYPGAVPGDELTAALAWSTSPEPYIGPRCALFKLTGIRLRPSRKERQLRESFNLLYRQAYETHQERRDAA